MYRSLLDNLAARKLSVARRLFALRRMARIAEERGDTSLTQAIWEAIGSDQRTIQLDAVRREYGRMSASGHPAVERLIDLTEDDLEAQQEEGQQRLIAIVEQILETYFAQSPGHQACREALLTPILEQIDRLDTYHRRRMDTPEVLQAIAAIAENHG